ncbi:serine hydrolase domain-containing protein [Streptomyces cinereospinus]|uniref:Serine hydrolase domain-containing protein n=1 Tax=Streptomyces cinereospinus TaxID=285561 RepID=A0ABV5NA36_9ACTN
MRIRLALCAGAAALSMCTGTVAAAPAPEGTRPVPAGGTTTRPAGVGPAQLTAAVDGVHRAGVPGVFAEVRDAGRTWRGASGVADVTTGRPVTPALRHRVGSVTKTFTAVAVMRQVEQGRIGLDTPIGTYLPHLVPGERGRRITVRMLLNHTSGIPDHIRYAFPSLREVPPRPDSLDDNRFRRFTAAELIRTGLAAPPAGEPGSPAGVYSNVNYLLLGELLEEVTGTPAERYITRDVVERAGLRHTGFPSGPRVTGPHARMYEALHGLIDPPRDYSVYDMSWAGTGAALVSTMPDLNRFYAALLAGRLVGEASLAQMQRTLPVRALDGSTIEYGLGLHKVTVPDCGTFWGHDGTVWGAGTMSLTRADGRRQMSVAVNLMRWNELDSAGVPRHHPVDDALRTLYGRALCGSTNP